MNELALYVEHGNRLLLLSPHPAPAQPSSPLEPLSCQCRRGRLRLACAASDARRLRSQTPMPLGQTHSAGSTLPHQVYAWPAAAAIAVSTSTRISASAFAPSSSPDDIAELASASRLLTSARSMSSTLHASTAHTSQSEFDLMYANPPHTK